jgi:hypothetical protein
MWCKKYGFKYADKLVPLEWIEANTNRRSLNLVNKLKGA